MKTRKIVLVGGCFDILHLGHIIFMEKARARGDKLIVLLESDQAITKLKGVGRPINNQDHRAKVLLALKAVDQVIKLPSKMTDASYDKQVIKIKPSIIATTKGDKYIHHKRRQANLVGAKVIEVTNHLPEKSTSWIEKIILRDL